MGICRGNGHRRNRVVTSCYRIYMTLSDCVEKYDFPTEKLLRKIQNGITIC